MKTTKKTPKTKKVCDSCWGKGFYTQMRANKIYKIACGKCNPPKLTTTKG